MAPFKDAWETGYRTRGRVWGGSPGLVPGFRAEGRVLELGCGDGKTLSYLVSSGAFRSHLHTDPESGPRSSEKDLEAGIPGASGQGKREMPRGSDSSSTGLTPGRVPGEVIGADFSREALRLCRGRAEFGSIRFVAADARCLPFRDGTFSLLLMIHVAGHATGQGREAMAREAARVLAPGGTVYFAGFARGDLREGKGTDVEPHTFLRKDGTITHYFTEDEVRRLFSMLRPTLVETKRWELRVRGVSHPRAEIHACFQKEPEITC
jgi:SAM-dependent methyltransferase